MCTKYLTKISISLILMTTLVSNAYSVEKFRVFDSTTYKNNKEGRGTGIPRAVFYGLEKMDIIYAGNVYKRSVNNKVSREYPPGDKSVEKSVEALKKRSEGFEFVCLDFEHWSLAEDNQEKLDENIGKYIATVDAFKKKLPDVKFGFYATLPVRDYYRALMGEKSEKYKKWQNQNGRLTALAESVDIIFPSLYTFTHNRANWVKYAVENIKEARRFGKPVFVFLWPQYHDSANFIGLDYIPADFWRLQLETVAKYADGAVIWGGWDFDKNGRQEWDENAPWWIATRQFMSDPRQR